MQQVLLFSCGSRSGQHSGRGTHSRSDEGASGGPRNTQKLRFAIHLTVPPPRLLYRASLWPISTKIEDPESKRKRRRTIQDRCKGGGSKR
eukprot:1316276-Pyramimonas_sp.AAC.1